MHLSGQEQGGPVQGPQLQQEFAFRSSRRKDQRRLYMYTNYNENSFLVTCLFDNALILFRGISCWSFLGNAFAIQNCSLFIQLQTVAAV